jgi:hypothetical protein
MPASEIAALRLRSQRLAGPPAAGPGEVLRTLGAVQSQDYGPAKWSLAQRTTGCTDAALEQAFVSGRILRTHVLRPTWHFVAPADIRWLLAATASRVQLRCAHRYRQLGLDAATRKTTEKLLAGALEGGNHLTRREVGALLERAGIAVVGQRLPYILMNAELQGLLCSGPPKGKQHTFALLEERAPQATRLTGDEALAELARRYFSGHGPATAKDLAAWASLTGAEVKRSIAMVAGQLEHEVVDGLTFWFAPPPTPLPAPPPAASPSPVVHLLQTFDEYVMGYGESRYVLDLAGRVRPLPPMPGVFAPVVVLDGQVAGRWRRTLTNGAVVVEVALDLPFGDAQARALALAADEFGAFLGLPASLVVRGA